MDSLSSTQKAKPRKMKTLVKKKSGVKLHLFNLFWRVLEISVVMVTVAKLCYELVITLEGFGLNRFVINRHFAFLLGNAIVIAIVVKCGFFMNQEPDAWRNNSNEFYEEFVLESSRGERSLQTDVIRSEAEKETKQRMLEKKEDMIMKRQRKIITEKPERKCYERCDDRIDTDDELLRYKIESFIARQRRNQKDEEFSII